MDGLAGLRVLEINGAGVESAASMAGKVLADLGATVVKIEPPGGDPERTRPPFPPGQAASPETSGAFAYLNTSKRSIVLDLHTPAGQQVLHGLAAQADILIHHHAPADMGALGLDDATLRAGNPALVVVSITPYGLNGPYRDYAASDLTLQHGASLAGLCPDAAPPPELPPVRLHGRHGLAQAGLHAAALALGAWQGALRHGRGAHVDVAIFEVLVGLLARHFVSYTYAGRVESRLTPNLSAPLAIFPCTDGAIYIIAVEQDQFERLMGMMGHPDWARDAAFQSTASRGAPEAIATINREVGAWTAHQQSEPLFHALQANRIGSAPVYLPADLGHDPHLQARGFFHTQQHPALGALKMPGAPAIMRDGWWRVRGPAPALVERGGAEAAPTPEAIFPLPRISGGAGKEEPGPPARPLEGVRVLDLSWVWAGPYTTQMLAFLGAEVIKVESRARLDLTRRVDIYPPGLQGDPDANGYFNQVGMGKRSIAVNLGHAEGARLLHRLAGNCDIIISNFATGVMERRGLGPEDLQRDYPGLIVAQLSAYGQTGPYSHYVGYGPAMVPMAGLAALTGYAEDRAPQNIRIAYADPNAGVYMVSALLAALEQRRRDPHARGQVIDMALWESLACTAHEGWTEHAVGTPYSGPEGNHDPQHAPHNLYRCAGDDAWVAIAVTDDAQWAGLCGVLADSSLGQRAELRTAAGRKAHEAELDALLGAWCATRTPWEVTHALQAVGVPAFPALTNRDLAADPHLAARGFLVRPPHPVVGGLQHTGIPWRMPPWPHNPPAPAPLLGADTDAVLGELLGLGAADIAELRVEGAIE